MKNSNVLDESKGVLLFAFNTDVDYVSIADQTARLADHFLGLSVSLVTDSAGRPEFAYDRVIRVDTDTDNTRLDLDYQLVQWRNTSRHRAYELTPYHATLLLDVDYLVLDNSLNQLFATKHDYLLQYHNVSDRGPVHETMGETSVPFVWATSIMFRRSPRAQMLFDLVARIQANYGYYRALYNIRETNYRNDYAFAIANIILNGYCIDTANAIPWPMFTLEEKINSIRMSESEWLHVRVADRAVVLPQQNIHVMDKQYLQSNSFRELVDHATA
jgi:hypothetical protein